jgi:ubiquinone/menaquinone biosynthesis C-methylase UbiE
LLLIIKKNDLKNNKKYFLKTGANDYFNRNKDKIINFKNELLSKVILNNLNNKIINVLEVGCGDASRLSYLSRKYKKINFFGVDPFGAALKNKKIFLKKATADKLPFKKNFFDVIIYGFCLYLTDNQDLIKIVFEADRVLKKNGIIIILDFYSKKIEYRKFSHKHGHYVRKMDYSKLFSWSPNYKVLSFKKEKYEKKDYTAVISLKKSY